MTKTKRSPFFAKNFEVNKTIIFDSQFPTQVMDFKTISTATATATATATIKTPDKDTELIPTSDPKSVAFRSLSFNNGPLKAHHPPPPPPPPQTVIVYRECLKNHAANIGGHALDGCGEFFLSPISNPTDPTSLKCAACGCHRNFHRREAPDEPYAFTPPKTILVSSATHHHRLLPPPPPQHSSSPSPSHSTSPGPSTTLSPHSPPPVSHVPPSFFGTPSHMLLALSSAAYTAPPQDEKPRNPTAGRKRSRTKFSQDQKDKMFCFADKLGWKLQRSEEKFVQDFCDQIGIGRNVFKVWMHNNKHHMLKKQRVLSSAGLINEGDDVENYGGDASGGASFDSNAEEENNNNANVIVSSHNESSRDNHHQRFYLSNNGSSSSS